MPDKNDHPVHPTNPDHIDKWSEMSDSSDFYVVQHALVGHARTTRLYEVSGEHGAALKPRKTDLGDPLAIGAIVSAKTLGPGADLQRLIDLGAIRPATQWETDQVKAELSGEAEKARKAHADKAKADADAKAKGEADAKVEPKVEPAKVEPVKPAEPVKPVDVKVEPAKVVEPEKK